MIVVVGGTSIAGACAVSELRVLSATVMALIVLVMPDALGLTMPLSVAQIDVGMLTSLSSLLLNISAAACFQAGTRCLAIIRIF